ncbi:MAG: hypothetical protein U1E40_10290 [Amaricoccus sp.]|mgnify:CR=1 FL=1
MTIDIRTDIPADIHPGILSEHQDVLGQAGTIGASVIFEGVKALTDVYTTIGKLNDAKAAWEAASPKTTRVVGGRATEVSLPSPDLIAAAERAFGVAARSVDEQTAALNRNVNALETRVASALTDPYSKTPLGAEIRQHIKGLKDGERLGFVRSLIASNKKSDVAAVLDAPSYLSGLTDDMHSVVRDMAADHFAPTDYRQLRATREVISRVERASGHLLSAFTKVLDKRDSPAAKAANAIEALG